MNVWTYSGRVGADAELRTTSSGEKVLNFRVCNKVGFGDRATDQWVDNSYWGRRAEAVAQYIKKGDRITVSGELKLEEYTDKKTGEQRQKLAVRVNDLDLASRNDGDNANRSQGASNGSRNRPSGYDGDRPLDREGGNRAGGGGTSRGGGKPAVDPGLDDEIPW
jgi:single-strand DNA-binding protein